ncbi:thioredoxin family protein [Melioribacter sp. OK-6-Me]|uniref:thioredoxin family protein n=1 Tax=unclassified Melioribacter TaxID=2627329 RepID=UPI003EDAF8BE
MSEVNLIKNNGIVLGYFSTPDCKVCKVLKPKVKELLEKEYPEVIFQYVDVSVDREVAAQLNVFAVPTLILFVDGKENFRLSRFVGLDELRDRISRIYDLYF